jgi:hypothetical protein
MVVRAGRYGAKLGSQVALLSIDQIGIWEITWNAFNNLMS